MDTELAHLLEYLDGKMNEKAPLWPVLARDYPPCPTTLWSTPTTLWSTPIAVEYPYYPV